jgi:2-polyprenyl-6-methoxyphenol hydroxylase-like FAD-dependent oxidoreductase
LIISGGISGLAAAIALQRVGIEAAVFEKAPHITEVGAGLSLWSNPIVALRRLVWGTGSAGPIGLRADADVSFDRGSVYGRRFRCVGQACGRSFHLSTARGASALPLDAAGLRDYETRRRPWSNFVIEQSRRLGTVLQLANSFGLWLRQVIGSTSWAQKAS